MEKTRLLLLAFALAAGLTGCGGTPPETTSQPLASLQLESDSMPMRPEPEAAPPSTGAGAVEDPVENSANILIAYFTRTGSTGEIADMIQAEVGGDILQIETLEPYPAEYGEVLEQARQEQEADFRPALAAQAESMEGYSTIFIGYPIWHGDVPMAILSFMESYDWSGKTVIPFCTHGGGGAYSSFESIANAAGGADIGDGFSIAGNAAGSAAGPVAEWLAGFSFVPPPENKGTSSTIHITVGTRTLTATLAENSSADALRDLLAQGPLTIEMEDYASMEKVGDLGVTLPANDEQITTGPGDLILYGGNAFVIYYAANTWSLTPLGKINGIAEEELKEILGTGDVTVSLSLPE